MMRTQLRIGDRVTFKYGDWGIGTITMIYPTDPGYWPSADVKWDDPNKSGLAREKYFLRNLKKVNQKPNPKTI